MTVEIRKRRRSDLDDTVPVSVIDLDECACGQAYDCELDDGEVRHVSEHHLVTDCPNKIRAKIEGR